MNSPGSRYKDLYDGPDPYRQYHHYNTQSFWTRLNEPSVVVSLLALLFTALYSIFGASALPTTLLSRAGQTLWDIIVWLTPYDALTLLEGWLHPPLFPQPMLQNQARTHAAKSKLLRKILGMDREGGIMGTVSQAGIRGLSSMSGAMMSFKGFSDHPPGLGNLDNSCYQNSILQGLASLKTLPKYLADPVQDPELDRQKVEAVDTLRNLIEDLNSARNYGKTLWTPGSLKNMSTWQQQDAQEYFSKLLDEVDKEIAKVAKATQKLSGFESDCANDDTATSQHSDDSGYQSLSTISKISSASKSLRNPLEGLTAQRVACVECGHSDGLSMIPFNCLTLSLNTDGNDHDLYELMDAYAHIESIEGVECGKCTLLKAKRLLTVLLDRAAGTTSEEKLKEPRSRLAAVEEALEEDDFEDKTLTEKCKFPANFKVSSTKTKQAVIARPPQSLAVHMNRSVFDENTGMMYKNSAGIRFPLTLDLGPWCLGSAPKPTTGKPVDGSASPALSDASDEEQWLLDPRSSMIAGDKRKSYITGPIYELRAVVTHYGRHENGHYVCYRKFPRNAPPSTGETKDQGEGDSDGASSPIRKPTPEDDVADVEMDWWRLSDESVRKIDEEELLDQHNVFMLFYDCVDPNIIPASEVAELETAIPASTDIAVDDDETPKVEKPAFTCTVTEVSETDDEENDAPSESLVVTAEPPDVGTMSAVRVPQDESNNAGDGNNTPERSPRVIAV
ncbi:Ubiquitin carboxyl-terminal hydrolase 1 [Colletotrichum siamense]|uniref:ubiquitinyl hydrolase 1 n=1 Tax=Colletotrichum siamense TaxID=690259 RepID=A0A9P5ELF7_COLSI|nr:Ubiquitin carboxyl-terminal hydrolase 1 [Colletotrichum siamense]KAF4853082.1 Ubiquitin carboxyl-terminal hydrolase 1 [Colletotrichum siamense]